ncbi:MAG: formyltetrahydrofolate deformylase [Propionibacteriaceae bacterium]|jgi:formyltetrahydrofolate deformylase|nr:formyltetrahydrofolate deformylase [Propionibacteriaceae bacterium]
MSTSVITFVCPDGPGIVHSISGAIVGCDGNITESQQYSSLDTGMFFQRIEVETAVSSDEFDAALNPVAERFGGTLTIDEVGRQVRTLVLTSSAPHALSALLSRQRQGVLPIDVRMVMGNHEELRPLAEFYDTPFEHIIVTPETKAAIEDRIREVVETHDIELVVLARYMQILSPELCEFLQARAINIHHSFLPGFKGANPYKQAHQRGVKLIGATAHFVTADLDEGPIIEQSVVPVNHAKTANQLRDIGRDIESTTLTHAVRLFAEHRILLDGQRTVIFD